MTGEFDIVLARWAAAFPVHLAPDVVIAAGSIPAGRLAKPAGSLFSPDSIDSDRHPVGLTVLGGVVDIPYRYYGEELRPANAPMWLSARQRTVLACMFTRHHLGFARQRWARELVQATEPWVVPFVVQLLGEYVVEIILDLQNGLSGLDDPRSAATTAYREVLRENPGFVQLTRQRATSYWSCYYRWDYLDKDDYPAQQLLQRFRTLAAADDV